MKPRVWRDINLLALFVAIALLLGVASQTQARVKRQSSRIGGDNDSVGGYKFEIGSTTNVPTPSTMLGVELDTSDTVSIQEERVRLSRLYVLMLYRYAILIR